MKHSSSRIARSLLAWVAVGVFWLLTTLNYHPSWHLALIATGSLVTAYAAASYINHLVLIPRYLRVGLYAKYAAFLLVMMAVFTGAALAILRTAYIRAVGPDLVGPIGINFGIDFFGMVVHIATAAGVVQAFRRSKKTGS